MSVARAVEQFDFKSVSDAKVTVDRALEGMAVTDRVYHDLRHTQPLAVELVRRVTQLGVGRALIVGSNALLAEALFDAGVPIELWQVSRATFTDGLEKFVTRRGSLDEILHQLPGGPTPEVVVLPYVLESTIEHPVELLARFRRWLPQGARLVVAYRPVGTLDSRLRAVRGRPTLPDPFTDPPAISLSWPPMVRRRNITADQLCSWCFASGFKVEEQEPVLSTHAYVAVDGKSVGEWLAAVAEHNLKRVVPALRDAVVATLTARSPSIEERIDAGKPHVTVVVGATDSVRLTRSVNSLLVQTYGADSLDVIAVVPPDLPDTDVAFLGSAVATLRGQVGPRAMNRALRQARGDVIAVTDDCSELPVEWVEQGVDSLTNWTAATTGPVVAAPGSAGPFLTLPGSRPNPGPEPWFSPFNSFYARAVALEVGGFDESRESPGWGGKTGWDTSLASRILRDGLPVRAVREPTVNRLFPFPRSEPYRWRKRWMAIEFIRACQLPAAIRALGVTGDRMLVGHVFASSRTALFDALVVGVVAAAISRNAWWLLLTIPWLYALRRYLPVWPPSEWSTAARNFQGILIRHALWLGGLAAGSIAARRPVL